MKLSQAPKYIPGPDDRTADVAAAIDAYIDAHTEPEPEYLRQVTRRTNLTTINPRMMAGHAEGRLLKMMVAVTGARRVLELGTFTGYSALAMAEALPDDGRLVTIEKNDEMEQAIRANLPLAPHGARVELMVGDALDVIPTLTDTFDLVFIDADKRLYSDYLELLLPHCRRGALILADNTLWDGKVLDPEPRPSDRQTRAIQAFNDSLVSDPRFESLILPLRDGLTMIRIK